MSPLNDDLKRRPIMISSHVRRRLQSANNRAWSPKTVESDCLTARKAAWSSRPMPPVRETRAELNVATERSIRKAPTTEGPIACLKWSADLPEASGSRFDADRSTQGPILDVIIISAADASPSSAVIAPQRAMEVTIAGNHRPAYGFYSLRTPRAPLKGYSSMTR